MLPPLLGYNVVAGVGAVISVSLTSFAGLPAYELKKVYNLNNKSDWLELERAREGQQ